MKAKDNPFASDRVQAIPYQPSQDTAIALAKRLEDLQFRAAILGKKGTGKTTLLRELLQIVNAKGRPTYSIFVNDNRHMKSGRIQRALAEVTPEHVVFLDSAGYPFIRSWWQLIRPLLRQGCGLVTTAHVYSPLTTLIQCTTTPELLAKIVNQLTPNISLPSETLTSLFQQHRGNIRDCLWDLYDHYAEQELSF